MAGRRHRGGYSSSWIHPATRLAIYLRDGLGCVYCERDWSRTDGMTIDHIHPRGVAMSPLSFGMSLNDPRNLVSACRRCNNLRRHIRASPLFGEDEWRSLAKALRTDADLKERVRMYASVDLGRTFRDRARGLCADPPAWLRELRRISTTHPNDQRVRAEEGDTPLELLALLQPDTREEPDLLAVPDDFDIPF